MIHALLALAFGIGIPGAFASVSLAFAAARDGSPFTRDFWNA